MLEKLSDFFAGVTMTIVSGVFLVLSLILMLTGTEVLIDPAWVTIILSGYPLLYLAMVRLIRDRWVSSALLISIAMIASLAIGERFAAGEVAFIMAIGAILEDKTTARARKGLSKLIDLTPVQGRRLIPNGASFTEEMVRADQIRTDDLIRVLPGETIPADGVVVSGASSVDQSIMTGESLPVDKEPGDTLFCGTINRFGSLDFRATAAGKHSSLQRLIRMVEEAEEKQAPMQRIADQWSVWLVPIALLIAVGAFLINWKLGLPVLDALNRGVTVLVVFCPCALALATPTSIMAAIGQATKHGVIIKSGEALEAMGKADTIAWDKTGTLTHGTLTVSDVCSFTPKYTEDALLSLVASVEARSEHPLGRVITAHVKDKKLTIQNAEQFRMEAGRGVQAEVQGKTLFCGSEAFLKQNGITCSPDRIQTLNQFRNQGKALILAADSSSCLGVVALSDAIRENAGTVISQLSELDTQSVLLTGDNHQAAAYIAAQAGMQEIQVELLPHQKVEAVENLQNQGRNVCMLGDGVNDAPALKTASVGVAMGRMGSAIAVDAADIALMHDDVSQVVYLKRLARSTINTIRGNITASMCINAVAVTLSVLGVLNPVTGALVHNAGSCLVVLNAALLYDRKFDAPKA